MSMDWKAGDPGKDYRKNVPIVSAEEHSCKNHRPRGKAASRSTRMFEVRNNQLETRSVSGNVK